MKTAYTILFLFCIAIVYGQGWEVSVSVDTLDDGLRKFEAHLLSDRDIDEPMSYEFLVIKTGANSSTNRQKGEFTVVKGQQVLSSVTVNVAEGESIKSKLFVYQGGDVKGSAEWGFSNEIIESSDVASKDNGKDGSLDNISFILDDTRTRSGRDFYDIFYSGWNELEIGTDRTITIKEQFIRGRNTRIEITLGDEIVFVGGLQSRYSAVESSAQMALRRVAYFVQRRNQVSNELSTGDIRGSGI